MTAGNHTLKWNFNKQTTGTTVTATDKAFLTVRLLHEFGLRFI